jgi:hypothetical protein
MLIFTWGYKLERLSNFVINHNLKLSNMVIYLYFSTTGYFFRENVYMILLEAFMCFLAMVIFKKSTSFYFLSMFLCICTFVTILMMGKELDYNKWFSVLLSIYGSLSILFACIQDKRIIDMMICITMISAFVISLLFF